MGCCLGCSGATEGLLCTDPKLLKIASKKPELVVSTCTFRRMLVVLRTEDLDDLHELVSRLGVEQEFGEQMFGRLYDDGIVSSADGTNFMIYQENLQRAMGKFFGGRWKENAAELDSWQKYGEKSKDEDKVTNTAGVENQGQQDQGSSRLGVSGDNISSKEVQQGDGRRIGSGKQEKAAKPGNPDSERGRKPKISTSGLLDVSLGMAQESPGMNGTRKRKGQASASRGMKVSEVEAGAGGELGKKKRKGRGK